MRPSEAGERRAALVVIHGIGAQPPLRTLGAFAQGLMRAGSARGAPFAPPRLVMAPLGGRLRPAVRLVGGAEGDMRGVGGGESPSLSLDVLEYHWAEHAVGGMGAWETFMWLLGVNLAGLDLRRQVPFTLQAAERRRVAQLLARQLLHVAALAGVALGLVVAMLFVVAGIDTLLAAVRGAWAELPELGAVQAGQLFVFLSLCATLGVAGRDLVLSRWEGSAVARLHAADGAETAWGGMHGPTSNGWRAVAGVAAPVVAVLVALSAFWAREPLGDLWRVVAVLLGQPSVAWAAVAVAVALAGRWALGRYVADIALYVTSDRLSSRARTRRAILDEGEALVRDLLAGGYDEVYVAGHSLGSVVALDILDRLARWPGAVADPALGRLRGLLTFGSPLDKVAYFFRQRPGEGEALRGQLLSYLHGVRRRRNLRDYGPYLAQPYELPFADLRWWQVHAPGDLLSDRLLHYEVDRRVILPLGNPLTAHNGYWADPTFFSVALDWLRVG